MKCNNCRSTLIDEIGCCMVCGNYNDNEIEEVLIKCDEIYKDDLKKIKIEDYGEQNVYGRYYSWKESQK